MRRDWDARAQANARYYVNTERIDWTDEQFFHSGEETVQEEILNDMSNICQGMAPREMRVLEIGCGVGRVTRALSSLFGEVHAVDVSEEMVRLAKQALTGRPNVYLYRNNGKDLSVLGDIQVDFAFSILVFQHIPNRDVIENYIREVHRLLKPGGLFKFQVQGDPTMETSPEDTWLGVPFSKQDACELAERYGFEMRYDSGAGEQYYWLWFFKKVELLPP